MWNIYYWHNCLFVISATYGRSDCKMVLIDGLLFFFFLAWPLSLHIQFDCVPFMCCYLLITNSHPNNDSNFCFVSKRRISLYTYGLVQCVNIFLVWLMSGDHLSYSSPLMVYLHVRAEATGWWSFELTAIYNEGKWYLQLHGNFHSDVCGFLFSYIIFNPTAWLSNNRWNFD